MKINVNEYNEILSYEGTPEELAEFVATGILFPYIEFDDAYKIAIEIMGPLKELFE